VNDNNIKKEEKDTKNRPIVLMTVLCFVLCLALLTGICAAVFRPNISSDAPFVGTLPTDDNSMSAVGNVTTSASAIPSYTRKEGYYTFLVCGVDKVSGNTDVMMLVSLDTKQGEVNILQIPRDTFLNRDTSGFRTTRINAIYTLSVAQAPYGADMRKKYAMEKLCDTIEGSLCVTIDRYILLDTKAFVGIVDAIGGVDYHVPFDMDYEDPEQELYIHLKEGMQHLDGKEAEQFIRYRSGYITGDIGRVETRADFLKAIYAKVRESLSLSVAAEMAKQLIGSVTTDATIDDIAFFASAVYGIDAKNINVKTLSGSAVMNPETGVWTYYALNKKAALADINRYMNAFNEDVSYDIFDKNAIFTDDPNGKNPYISEYYYS
jgi:LCP family protein required for cell wall assembly